MWAYTRDSGGDDQDVTAQNRAVQSYCQESGLLLERLFCDEARPGSTLAGRDQFEEMIYLAHTLPQNLLPAGLVLWRFSRFGRNYDDCQFFKADLRRRGFTLVAIADDIPTDGGYSRVIEAFTDWHNEQFLKDLSRDVKRGLHDLAQQGYAPGGFPPVGYLAEKVQIGVKRNGKPRLVSRWVADPEKAPLVRRAWEMRAAGTGYDEIDAATHLFASKGSYFAMFCNKTYLGIRRCGDLEVEGAFEPLITRELWASVQARHVPRPRKGQSVAAGQSHAWRNKSTYLLSGMGRCLYCGSAMVGGCDNVKTRPNPWPYYLCAKKFNQRYSACIGKKIAARKVEQAVLNTAFSIILTPDYVLALVEAVNAELDKAQIGLDAQIHEAQERLRETERAVNNLLDLAETFGANAALARLEQREAERQELETRLLMLDQRRRQSHIEVSEAVVLDVIAGIRTDLTGDDVRVRREILRRFIHHIEIGNDGGKLWYSFPLELVLPAEMLLVPPRHPELHLCQLPW